MITHPTAVELADSVARWIDQIRPDLKGRDNFLARVAVNALRALQRELEQGPAAEAAAVGRLEALLGRTGSYAELNAELCRRLRDGEMDRDTPGLLPALKAEVLDRLAIDQPSYAHDGTGPR